MSPPTAPDPDTLLAWLDADHSPELDALEAQLAAPASTADERARAATIRGSLDRPRAPDGLPDAVLDAVYAVMRPRSLRRLALWPAAGLVMAAALAASPLVFVPTGPTLVTVEEAALPTSLPGERGTAPAATTGPALDVQAHVSSWTGRVDLDLAVRPGPAGVPVAPGTLRVTYLRGNGIDLTTRLGITPQTRTLSLEGLDLPAGTHVLEVAVTDVEGRRTTRRVEVTVP